MERFKLDEVLLKKRILLLTGEITKEKINVLRNLLFFLNSISKKEIKLVIDTRGGEVSSALKFYDAIRFSSAPVICIVNGECSSSGVAILQAGKKRLMTEHSFIYLHPVSIYFEKEVFVLDEKTEERFKDRLTATRARQQSLYKIIGERTGLSLEEIKKKEGKIIRADEAKKLGLIDKVIKEYKIF
jgi:ATP-dependent Clp endopeptidase proteolytic subunit ClpP